VFASATVCTTLGDSSRLTSDDVTYLKRLCRTLVGESAAHIDIILGHFTPYLRTNDELKRHYFDCSSQHCTGTLKLRDDIALVSIFPIFPIQNIRYLLWPTPSKKETTVSASLGLLDTEKLFSQYRLM
jgi:hypothetical protein